ncbi:MAG: hypothetical protein ACKO1Y_04325 [Actinomycetota bacterium]
MRPSRRPLALVGAIAVTVLVGCSAGGSDPAALRRGLERAGLTVRQAECVVDAMRDDLDPTVLDSRSDPSARDRAEIERILTACGVSSRSR